MKRDWFTEAFGYPVADIRAKLIDEAWFGRKANEHRHGSDLGWFRHDQARFSNAVDPDRNADRQTDRGIDR